MISSQLPSFSIFFFILFFSFFSSIPFLLCSPICHYPPSIIPTLRHRLPTVIKAQPVAISLALDLLEHHIIKIRSPAIASSFSPSSSNPPASNTNNKPLVLSLHGFTGTGKSLFIQTVANSIFPPIGDSSGIDHPSPFVHTFHSNDYHLSKSEKEIELLIKSLNRELIESIDRCALSIFIFEEIHLMHPLIIESLKKYMNNHAIIGSHNFNHAIFLLSSNFGGTALGELLQDAVNKNIRKDKIDYSIIYAKLKKSLETPLYVPIISDEEPGGKMGLIDAGINNNNNNGIHLENPLSILTRSAIVDKFLPFFPLYKHDVKQCFDSQLRQLSLFYEYYEEKIGLLSWSDAALSYLSDHLEYEIGGISRVGCKQVSETIATIIPRLLAPKLKGERYESLPWKIIDTLFLKTDPGIRYYYPYEKYLLEIDYQTKYNKLIIAAERIIDRSDIERVAKLWIDHGFPVEGEGISGEEVLYGSLDHYDHDLGRMILSLRRKLRRWGLLNEDENKKRKEEKLSNHNHNNHYQNNNNNHNNNHNNNNKKSERKFKDEK